MAHKSLKHTPFITLMGPDGVGKTSLLEYLEAHPEVVGAKGLLPILRKMPSVPGDSVPFDPAPLPPHNWLKSIAKIMLRFLEWQWDYYFGEVARARSRGLMIASDRFYFLDMLIDPLRYRYAGPSWLLQLALKLSPGPDLTFLLDAPAEILLARKHENSLEYIEHWRQVYRTTLLPLPTTHVIDVSGSIEATCAQIHTVIREHSAG